MACYKSSTVQGLGYKDEHHLVFALQELSLRGGDWGTDGQ